MKFNFRLDIVSVGNKLEEPPRKRYLRYSRHCHLRSISEGLHTFDSFQIIKFVIMNCTQAAIYFTEQICKRWYETSFRRGAIRWKLKKKKKTNFFRPNISVMNSEDECVFVRYLFANIIFAVLSMYYKMCFIQFCFPTKIRKLLIDHWTLNVDLNSDYVMSVAKSIIIPKRKRHDIRFYEIELIKWNKTSIETV